MSPKGSAIGLRSWWWSDPRPNVYLALQLFSPLICLCIGVVVCWGATCHRVPISRTIVLRFSPLKWRVPRPLRLNCKDSFSTWQWGVLWIGASCGPWVFCDRNISGFFGHLWKRRICIHEAVLRLGVLCLSPSPIDHPRYDKHTDGVFAVNGSFGSCGCVAFVGQ